MCIQHHQCHIIFSGRKRSRLYIREWLLQWKMVYMSGVLCGVWEVNHIKLIANNMLSLLCNKESTIQCCSSLPVFNYSKFVMLLKSSFSNTPLQCPSIDNHLPEARWSAGLCSVRRINIWFASLSNDPSGLVGDSTPAPKQNHPPPPIYRPHHHHFHHLGNTVAESLDLPAKTMESKQCLWKRRVKEYFAKIKFYLSRETRQKYGINI